MPWDETRLVQALLQYGEPQLSVESTGFYSRCAKCGRGFSRKDKKMIAYVSPTFHLSFCPIGDCYDWCVVLCRQMDER